MDISDKPNQDSVWAKNKIYLNTQKMVSGILETQYFRHE